MIGTLPGWAMSSADRRSDCQVLRDEHLKISALPIISRELAYQPPGDSFNSCYFGRDTFYYANESKISGCAVPDMKTIL